MGRNVAILVASFGMAVMLSGCSLWGWGANESGQAGLGQAALYPSPVPVDPADATITSLSITTGGNHSCRVDDQGGLWCWGRNHFGQLGNGSTEPEAMPTRIDGSDWVQVSASGNLTCGLRSDQSLWCWGNGSFGRLGIGESRSRQREPIKVAGEAIWKAVSTGPRVSCGIQADDSLWCWGFVDGPGSNADVYASPIQVGTEKWQQISAGSPTCGILLDGTIDCFDTDQAWESLPATLATDTWLDVSVGSFVACAVKADGTLWCWGSEFSGIVDGESPQVGNSTDWRTVAVGEGNACGLRADGSRWCWGDNSTAQLGDGTTTERPEPIRSDSATWQTVSASLDSGHMCGIDASGQAQCWGDDSYSAASGGPLDLLTPQLINGGSWQQVSTGANHSCGVATDASLWCWGSSESGQIGDGNRIDRVAVTPIGTAQWTDISAGDDHTCGVQTDGSLWCWGDNFFGQVGVAGTVVIDTPRQVGAAGEWNSVESGFRSTCGIKSDGSLWCWGENQVGQLGLGTVVNPVVAPTQVGSAQWKVIALGSAHACGIQVDDSLWCWGSNIAGSVLGDPSLGDPSDFLRVSPTPSKIGTATWKYLSAGVADPTRESIGTAHTCGIQTDDTLWCWGPNYEGEVGTNALFGQDVPALVMTPAATWIDIATGSRHTCGIQSDGSLWCWGQNVRGQLGLDSTVGGVTLPVQVGNSTNWASVSAGGQRTNAIQS